MVKFNGIEVNDYFACEYMPAFGRPHIAHAGDVIEVDGKSETVEWQSVLLIHPDGRYRLDKIPPRYREEGNGPD